MAPKTNLTGFDPKKLAAASGQPLNDPWRRAEAWRYEGPFTLRNRFRGALPGFGTAVVAFGAYLVVEAMFLKREDHAHGSNEEHH